MDKNIFVQKIQASAFLVEEEKNKLTEYLDSLLVDREFGRLFDEIVGGAVERQGEKYTSVVHAFGESAKRLEDDYEKEKQAIEQRCFQKLATLFVFDARNRGKVWVEYYEQLERAQRAYQKNLKALIVKTHTTALYEC